MKNFIMWMLIVVFGWSILLNGSTFASIRGKFAQRLDLAGSSIIPAVPWIALAVFIVGIIISFRFKRVWVRWVGSIAAILIGVAITGYPEIIYDSGTRKIHLSEEPSYELMDQFTEHFGVKAVWYSNSIDGVILAVRKDDYSPEMELYVKEAAQNLAK